MSKVIDQFNTQVMPVLSLERADACWGSTLADSLLCRTWRAVSDRLVGSLSSFSAIGTRLQQLSFLAVLLLCLILAAPQFANDKEGLALVILAALGLRVVGSCLGGSERYKPSAIDGVVLLYFASNVVSSFASHYLHESLFGLAKLFVYVLAYFLFVGCFQTDSKRRIIACFSALTLGALLVSLYGLYQYKIGVAPLATWEDPSIEDKATRVFSTLGNPNLLAGYLIPLIPVSFAVSAITFCRKDRWRWLGIPLLGVCGVIKLATILTASRGAYIAILFIGVMLLFVGFSWIWKQVPRARLALIGGVVVLPVVAALIVHFALPSTEHRFLSIFLGTEHSSNAYRVNVWKSSYEMFKDNWWLGIGTGNKTFRLAYGLYMRSGFDALGTYCVPLEVAVENGVHRADHLCLVGLSQPVAGATIVSGAPPIQSPVGWL